MRNDAHALDTGGRAQLVTMGDIPSLVRLQAQAIWGMSVQARFHYLRGVTTFRLIRRLFIGRAQAGGLGEGWSTRNTTLWEEWFYGREEEALEDATRRVGRSP